MQIASNPGFLSRESKKQWPSLHKKSDGTSGFPTIMAWFPTLEIDASGVGDIHTQHGGGWRMAL